MPHHPRQHNHTLSAHELMWPQQPWSIPCTGVLLASNIHHFNTPNIRIGHTGTGLDMMIRSFLWHVWSSDAQTPHICPAIAMCLLGHIGHVPKLDFPWPSFDCIVIDHKWNNEQTSVDIEGDLLFVFWSCVDQFGVVRSSSILLCRTAISACVPDVLTLSHDWKFPFQMGMWA